MLADQQDPGDFPPEDSTATEATTEPAATEPAPESASPPPATVGTAATAPAAPGDITQDEIFLATADAPPATSDPQAIRPPAAAGDTAPGSTAAPPPFGTVYRFDADGRIVPTPEGIVTPEGVTLTAGKPPRVPPLRPEAVAAAALAAAATPAPAAAAAPQTTESTALPPPDPALAGARPRPRPAGIAPDDGAALDAPAAEGDSRATSLRPRGRTPTVLAAGEAARLATASASLAAGPEQVTLASAPAGGLQISRRPAPRPRDLSRAVEAAVAAAVKAAPPVVARPEPEPVVVATAPPKGKPAPEEALPEADDEPEVASAAPKIPVKASVAKQATVQNAISLSKTNLIGVYGSPSNRYALIRQSNGRYKKVKPGDTVDGGRITAISATEVMYQKGSRSLKLSMPKG